MNNNTSILGAEDKISQSFYRTLVAIIAGKTVLDIGAVQHSITNIKHRNLPFLHGFICSHAKEATGIDIEKKQLSIVNKEMGTNILYGDAQDFNIGKYFDVIFAGELIEHLENPGLFIQNAKKHLSIDGVLVLTTPNSFSLIRIILNLIKNGFNNDPVCNYQHTMWQSPTTLKQLLSRFQFEIESVFYWSNRKVLEKACNLLGLQYILPHMMVIVRHRRQL